MSDPPQDESRLRATEALMAKFVGLDPDKDIHLVDDSKANPRALFIDWKIDTFLSSPPENLELRARGIGHSLVNTATDRPWSQYYCCMVASKTEFVQKYPMRRSRSPPRSTERRHPAAPTTRTPAGPC